MDSVEAARADLPEGASCIARMQSLRDALTPGQRQLVDTVLTDPRVVVLASVADLARRAGTSEAAVSRFARAIGFGSYAEFKLALSRDLDGSAEAIHEDVVAGDRLDVLIEKVASANVQAIRDTLRALDVDTVGAVVDAIASADRIAFFGFGGSASVAHDAAHHFLRTGHTVFATPDAHEQVMWASSAGSADVFVLFSHTGRTRDLCDVAEIARERGATVVSVTNLGSSPLARLADLALFTSARETKYREESMSSRIAAMTIIDALYVGVSLRTSPDVTRRRERIRRGIQRKRI